MKPLAALAVFCSLSARAGNIELVPELGVRGTAPSAPAAFGAAPLQLAPNALVPVVNLAAPSLAGTPVLAPTLALAPLTPLALVPVHSAPAKAVPVEGRPLLIKSLAAPALDASKISAGDSGAAEKDFNERAQLDAPSALGAGVLTAPSAESAPKTGRLALGHSSKGTVKPAARAVEGLPLDLVTTPESLREMAERGESGTLLQSPDGRWRLAPRESASPYPTPEELEAAAGKEGRFFVVSKAGLVEWNALVPEGAADGLRSRASRLALRVPGLASAVLGFHGVAVRRTSWDDAVKGGLAAGEAPLNENVLIAKTIPALIAEEFPLVAAKLGRPVDAAYAADVLKRSNGYRMYWHSATTYKDHPDNVGIPDGHFRSDFGIRLMVKPDWRRMKDLSTNYRPLFAHEYVHWLQNEGFISNKYGAEVAAVAVEVLRAIELVGLTEVVKGRAATVHPGVLGSFDGGRETARAGFKNEATAFYSRGALAGAAYEAGLAAGRPEAAWEFLNLVIAGKGALEPSAAWARVVGSK
jgi:hypothetical protein